MMKRAIVVATSLSLAGCSGFGKFISDTATLPGANPNAPMGQSENMLRVRGYAAAGSPILAQPGNIWPDAPEPLPTMEDVERNPVALDKLMRSTGGVSSGDMAHGPQMSDDQSMSMGETTQIHSGVQTDFSGPGMNVPTSDSTASQYGAKRPNSSIVIPNDDGTSTIIGADGTVRTVKSATPAVH